MIYRAEDLMNKYNRSLILILMTGFALWTLPATGQTAEDKGDNADTIQGITLMYPNWVITAMAGRGLQRLPRYKPP